MTETKQPLLVLDRVREFLDAHGLGAGELHAQRIGEGGGSNFSFLLERGDGSRFVLRRPPRPPLPPTAHDVVRESRLQLALAPLGIRVPTIRAVCEDDSLLGVFFEKAPLRLRRQFLELIGTDLSGEHDVSERVLTKLQQLAITVQFWRGAPDVPVADGSRRGSDSVISVPPAWIRTHHSCSR